MTKPPSKTPAAAAAAPAGPSKQPDVSMIKDPAYWQALGEFIEAFASVETILFNYLVFLSKIQHSMAKAIFGGNHIDQLIQSVRNVVSTQPLPAVLDTATDAALTQLKIISNVRNSVIHYVSFVVPTKGRVSSNITRARSRLHLKEYRASVTMLKKMIVDLERISQLLIYCQFTLMQPMPWDFEKNKAGLPALDDAWQYIQP